MRLPTEAEWEYACRAGTLGPTWLGEPCAAHIDRIASYSGNSGSQSHPVKEKTANPWGLFDMLGNVWEWCSVGAEHSAVGAAVDSTGPLSSTKRVSRGGSWNLDARGTRSAASGALEPGIRLGLLGCSVLQTLALDDNDSSHTALRDQPSVIADSRVRR